MSERRQFRSRSNRTGDETRFGKRRIIIRQPFSKLRRFQIDIVGLRDHPEFRQHDFAAAEAVRFDDITADFQKSDVNFFNRFGFRIKQIFRAVLKIRAAPIFNRQILPLQITAHRAVKNDYFFF